MQTRPGEYTSAGPATTGRGIELLSDWLATHARQPGTTTAEQIRQAAAAGDEIARKIVATGIFDLETK